MSVVHVCKVHDTMQDGILFGMIENMPSKISNINFLTEAYHALKHIADTPA